MNLSRLWAITRLELLQRVRTVSWYVLLGVFAFLLVGVTALAFIVFGGWGPGGPGVYSIVVCFTLLLVLLVSPTLSGNSINGDRDASTLAALQVSLATTGEILWGKFLAAWITGLAFVVVATPFLVVATLTGGVNPLVVVVSLAILVAEIAVVSAIGVALSGILARPLFSVAVTYLVVAALTFGSSIAFGLVGASITSEGVSKSRSVAYNSDGTMTCRDGSDECWGDAENMVCEDWETTTYRVPRFDRVWWMLSTNPFVILADASPTTFDDRGNPDDLFGWIKAGVRSAQITPPLEMTYDDCDPAGYGGYEPGPTPEEVIAQTVPSWFVGLAVQIAIAGLLLWWAWARTRTPARTLPPGTRIA
ncbi:ABC transporter permease [Microbacterium sp. bgisy203]|uniref:ABC transporter permease n=1 Tax=Microbacterium sp. bgisy203 TaxID=3413799 RepID=UPI003D7397D0